MDVTEAADAGFMRHLRMSMERTEREAGELAAQITGSDDWQWNVDKLIRRTTEAKLYRIAVDDSVERAAALAMRHVREVLSAGGSTDQHDVAAVKSRAVAASQVLETLTGAGLTAEQVGRLFLGER